MPEKRPNSIKLGVKRRPMGFETKTAVSVAEMARMVGLSRARFYQLIGSAFPHPVYDVSTRRPFYDEEAQTLCLEVRRRNSGIDGKPILFYARRPVTTTAPKKRPNVQNPNVGLLEGLKGLGLVATSGQVDGAVKELFPKGTDGVEPAEVVRSVFIHLQKKSR
jgi:hypothetical protein